MRSHSRKTGRGNPQTCVEFRGGDGLTTKAFFSHLINILIFGLKAPSSPAEDFGLSCRVFYQSRCKFGKFSEDPKLFFKSHFLDGWANFRIGLSQLSIFPAAHHCSVWLPLAWELRQPQLLLQSNLEAHRIRLSLFHADF